MCAGTEVDGVPVEADHLGEAQARLDRDQQQGAIAAAEPRRQIRGGKDCLDLGACQEVHLSLVVALARYGEHAYERNGTANIFMLFAPLEGWRHVEVTDRHAAADYAAILRDLSDRYFPGASKIILVQDNLSTHTAASLYAVFAPAQARRLAERFEWHYTPKHGSWLNMAESELGVLTSQCSDRRIANKDCLTDEVAAWQEHRNRHHAKANWQFTNDNARVKLRRLYPSL